MTLRNVQSVKTRTSIFKQEVLTQKYLSASNLSAFSCSWKDLKVSLVCSKEGRREYSIKRVTLDTLEHPPGCT